MNTMQYHWGRLVYSIPLGIVGLVHLLQPQGTAESLTSFLPGGLLLIYLSGICWLVLAFALILNLWVRYASIGVLIMLSLIITMVHIPALYEGHHELIALLELLKDIGLMSGPLFLLSLAPKKSTQEMRSPRVGSKVQA